MSVFHRAFLYVTRKTAKTFILFLIVLVIATLALSGIAIQGAAETAQLNVRQALGGIFTLQQNTSDPDKWVSTQVGGYGSTSYYGGAPLTVELADYIQSHVNGIRGYNASYINYSVPLAKNGKPLKLLESEDDGSGLGSLLAGFGDFNFTVSTYASTHTAYDSFFTGGYLELAEGRHFTTEDKNIAIISQELASLNGLEVGDTITLRMSEYKASMMGYDAGKTATQVKIVGLFRSTAKSTTSLSNWSMDNSIYTTLDVVRTVRPDMGDESYTKIQFYVDDPGNMDKIVNAVKNLPDLDSTDFVVNVDTEPGKAHGYHPQPRDLRLSRLASPKPATPQGWNSGVYGMIRTLSDNVILPIAGVILAFVMTLELIQLISSDVDAVTEPLTNMIRLVSVLIVLVLTVGAAILCLVLSSRIKERVHESGILLSLGLPKRKIILQYLSEVAMIAVLALSLSVFTGGIVAQTVGNQLLDYTISDAAGQNTAQQGYSKDGVQISDSDDYAPSFEGKNSMTAIDVDIKPIDVVSMFAVGLFVCCAAVVIASLPVLRMKPREILSKMS